MPGPLPAPVTTGVKVRKLMLFEGTDAYGRLRTMLGTVNPAAGNPAGTGFGTFLYTRSGHREHRAVGSTEIWEIYNTTVDAHPIHLHLTNFPRPRPAGASPAPLVPKPMGFGATGGYLTRIASPAPAPRRCPTSRAARTRCWPTRAR